MRSVSLKILSDTRSLSYDLTGDLYFHIGRIISKSWELVSLVEISTNVGFISDMNYQVVKNALIGFIGDLRNRQRIEGFQQIDELKVNAPDPVGISLKDEFFIVHSNDITTQFVPENKKNVKDIVKNTVPSKGHTNTSTDNISERKANIYSFIKENKDVIVNDIMSHFNGHNKKMIQRDLVSLMTEGKIKRTGEKRWSRYSISDN